MYHTMGAAISILIAYISSSLVSLISIDSRSFRSILFVCSAILVGYITGAVTLVIDHEQHVVSVVLSIVVTLMVIYLKEYDNKRDKIHCKNVTSKKIIAITVVVVLHFPFNFKWLSLHPN